MLVGAIIAVTQTDVKRLLAYSSVAHAGFLLAGVIATDKDGVSSVLFYLAAYSFVTLGAFAVVTLVRDAGGEATHLSRWAGLGRRSPLVAAVFAVFLLAFAGIPLTSGFAGKFAVFKAAAQGGAMPLVIVGVISSAIAAFFYVRVIVLMFFSEPKADGPTVAVPSPLTSTAIAIGVAVTLVLGLAPAVLPRPRRQGGRVRPLGHGPWRPQAARTARPPALRRGPGRTHEMSRLVRDREQEGEAVGRVGPPVPHGEAALAQLGGERLAAELAGQFGAQVLPFREVERSGRGRGS